MARFHSDDDAQLSTLRRILLGTVLLLVFLLFLVWRIDNPRVERLRTAAIEAIVPNMEWALVPVTQGGRMIDDFESYARVYEQNQELRRELQRMQAWREAALQLEQENAQLRDLNNVRLDPELSFVTGVVAADSGSSFRRSLVLNIGSDDTIQDGWAAMDGLGLVGRIAGVSERTSRVLLLTDNASMVPVRIQPSGQTAILTGDSTAAPVLEFIETPEQVRPGDRIVTSGDGKVFPDGLLIGQVSLDRDGRLRARLAADFERFEFLRVLRANPHQRIGDAAPLIAPQPEPAPADLDSAEEPAPDANDG